MAARADKRSLRIMCIIVKFQMVFFLRNESDSEKAERVNLGYCYAETPKDGSNLRKRHFMVGFFGSFCPYLQQNFFSI